MTAPATDFGALGCNPAHGERPTTRWYEGRAVYVRAA